MTSRIVDARERFRERCLSLARARADGSEVRVAALFRTEGDLGTVLDTRAGADPPLVRTANGARSSALASPEPERLPEPHSNSAGRVSSARPEPARLLIVPGLLGDNVRALVAPLMCARAGLRAEGRDVSVAWVNGRAGCTRNAARLRTVVLEAAAASGRAVDLVGYSKGCADALHMLGDWPDTHAALRSLVSLGGIVHGTPLARDAPPLASHVFGRLPLPGPMGCGDGRAIVDLTPTFRRRWLEEHSLPESIRYASIVANPSSGRVSRVLKPSWRTLARHDPHNDGQVIARDALLPCGELLATIDADHWALALPIAERSALLARFAVTRNDFPRTLMLEALMDHLALPLIAAGQAEGERM